MPTNSLIEVHEDRIVRLEDGVGECKVGIALLASKMDNLGDKMDAVSELKKRVDTIEVHERVRGRLVKLVVAGLTLLGGAAGFVIKILLGG